MVAGWLAANLPGQAVTGVTGMLSRALSFDPSTLGKTSCHLLKAMGLRREKLLSLLDQTNKFSVPRGNLE